MSELFNGTGSYGADDCVIGVDFGTLSARAVVVRVKDGNILGEAVAEYEHGVIRRLPGTDTELPPDWALQDPEDYLAALKCAIGGALRA
ncbi:MAG: ribulokinase, partial [Clostridia bacterium]|nr:ribulokinase [Clostridia bacterium]